MSGPLVSLHQSLAHNHRLDILSCQIAQTIRSHYAQAEEIRCLDVGCGDMQIAERIGVMLPSSRWSCIDIHALPEELKNQERWLKYRTFDGANTPFPDGGFDVVLIEKADAL